MVQQHMIVAAWRGSSHEGKSFTSSNCVFSLCYGGLLPGSTNLDSPWTHWVCRRNRILLVEVSVIVQHRYHCPPCVLLLYGLWKKGQKEKFGHWLMDYNVPCFRHVSFLIFT